MSRIGAIFLTWPLFVFLLLDTPCLHAGSGLYGAKAAAMGTAFVAVSDDPSAMAFNPAGLVAAKGSHVYGGGTVILPYTKFRGRGYSEHTEFQAFFPPFLYMASDLGTRDLRFGVGFFSPFGMGGRKWPTDGIVKYRSVEGFTATGAVNPTIAWRLSPYVSIGLGLSYTYSRMESKSRINQSSLGAPDGRLDMTAQGGGWGYNGGILFAPSERWSMGIAYRSRIKVDHHGKLVLSEIASPLQPLFGGSRFRTALDTTCTFPNLLALGLAFRPSPKWILSVEAERFGWSTFGSSEIKVKRKVPAAGMSDRTTRLDWRDTWSLKAGAEYRWTGPLTVRGGYAFFPTYVPDHTIDPGNPETNQHNISVGLGYACDTWQLDVFYNLGLWENRKVDNAVSSGEYRNRVHYMGFGIGKAF